MKKFLFVSLILLFISTSAFAIPTLQLAAPAGIGDTGDYADYIENLTDPIETDTAITSGSILYAAGAYGAQADVYIGGYNTSGDKNWSDFGFDTIFNSSGAILMATVLDGSLGSGSITVNSLDPIYTTETYKSGFAVPNNHAPVPGNDYMFFNIGDFAKNSNEVPDFASETGAADGEIKILDLVISGFDWVHFDLLAIVTDSSGNSTIKSTLDINPGSHDVTWKESTTPVPEPATMLLLGTGLVGLAGASRKKFLKKS